jgi:hypothetical protein
MRKKMGSNMETHPGRAESLLLAVLRRAGNPVAVMIGAPAASDVKAALRASTRLQRTVGHCSENIFDARPGRLTSDRHPDHHVGAH